MALFVVDADFCKTSSSTTTEISTTPTAPLTTITTPTISPTILVLSTRYSTNQSFTVDFYGELNILIIIVWIFILKGNVDSDLNFEYGENAAARGGCGATLMGEMWYFGGDRNVVFFIISNKYKSFFR